MQVTQIHQVKIIALILKAPALKAYIYNLEFHKITRGCLNEKIESFIETDIQVGCWNADSETEEIELQIPPEYRVENGYLHQLCRRVDNINS